MSTDFQEADELKKLGRCHLQYPSVYPRGSGKPDHDSFQTDKVRVHATGFLQEVKAVNEADDGSLAYEIGGERTCHSAFRAHGPHLCSPSLIPYPLSIIPCLETLLPSNFPCFLSPHNRVALRFIFAPHVWIVPGLEKIGSQARLSRLSLNPNALSHALRERLALFRK